MPRTGQPISPPWATIALVSVLAFASGALGQVLDAAPSSLAGTELLIELDKNAPSTEQPGLYAWTERGGFRRLVSYGRRPRWSPQHDQIVYWCDGQLWRLRVGETKARPVWLGTQVVDDMVEWMPDGKGWLVRAKSFLDKRVPGVSYTPLRALDEPAGEGVSFALPLWERALPESVRRWSARDNQSLAYEHSLDIPGLGVVACEVRLGTVGSPEFRVVEAKPLADAVLFNPRWQPGGRWLAMDAAERAGRGRMVVLYDPQTDEWRSLGRQGFGECRGWVERNESSALLRWRPDGRELMVVIGGEIQPIPASAVPAVVSVTQAGEPSLLGAPAGRVVASAWALDGRSAAVAVSNWLTPYVGSHMRLVVRTVDANGANPGSRFVDLPAGLQVVDMDW